MFTEQLSFDATPGTWVVALSCLDTDATVVDTGQLTFEVAALGLQLSPGSGPAGTASTASGSGCPVGRTESEVLWLLGAGDDLPAWDPLHPGVGAPAQADGSFAVPFVVPSNAQLGELLVVVWCVSEGGSALAGPFVRAFIVTEPGTIPGTGWSPTLAWVAVALVASGVLLLALRRRIS